MSDLAICSRCGAELDLERRSRHLCSCQCCGMINILPKSQPGEDMLRYINEGNNAYFDSEFYKAFNAFRYCSVIDRSHPEFCFAMALASNSVKYVYDTYLRSYVPVCFDTSEKQLLEDTNVLRAIQFAENDAERADYEARVKKIDFVKQKFRDYSARGVKCDIFISSASKGGSAASEFADGLYSALKTAGLAPFYAKNDLPEDTNDGDYITLYALKSAKLFIQVCDNELNLSSSSAQRDYLVYNALINGHQRSQPSILVASQNTALGSLPGLASGVKGVNICSSDCVKEINEFIKPYKSVKLKIKAIETKHDSKAEAKPQEQKVVVNCNVCGSELSEAEAAGGCVICTNCESQNVLPKSPRKASVIQKLSEADAMLGVEQFDGAYKSYVGAIMESPLESKAWFGSYLAKNKVNYVFNPYQKEYVPLSHNTDKLSGFNKPGVLLAHALATSNEQNNTYTAAVERIDGMRELFRKFEKQGINYDVFITVDERDSRFKKLDEWAKGLYQKLQDKGLSPFYANENGKIALDFANQDEHKIYAVSKAKVMIILCNNGNEISGESSVTKEYNCFFKGRENKRTLVVGKDNMISNLPGCTESIEWYYVDSATTADKICDEISEFNKAQGESKYCSLCERRVNKSAKLCPHCLSFKFSENKSDCMVYNHNNFIGLTEIINKAFKFVASHALKFLIGLVALVLAVVIGIGAGAISNIGKYSIKNSEYDVSVTSASRIFDKKDVLSVTTQANGTEYQIIRNNISLRFDKDVEELVIYSISCDKVTGEIEVKLPLTASMNWASEEDIAVLSIVGESVFSIDYVKSDKHVSFYTYDLGSFALVRLGDDLTVEGGNGSIMDSDLYQLLQTAENIDLSYYTPNSHEQFNNAYGYALDIFGFAGASEQDIYDATEWLRAAIDELVPLANFTELLNVITQAQECFKNKKHYTKESLEDLQYSYDIAMEVYNDKNSTQEEVDQASNNLSIEIRYLDVKRTFFENLIVVVLTAGMFVIAHFIMVHVEFPRVGEIIIGILIAIFMFIYMKENPEWTVWKMLLTDLIVTLIFAGLPIGFKVMIDS